MSYKLDIRLDPDYLYVQATGNRSMETIMAIAQDCQKACDQHGYKKILIDAQGMTGKLPAFKAFELGRKDFEKLKRPFRLKTAVVDLEKNRERFAFFETVLVNSGFNVRIFSKVSDAEQWLRENKGIST